MNFDNFFARKGLNQTSLAAILETTSQNVSRWCSGIGVPSYKYCKRLLELGMTVEELFDIDLYQIKRVNEFGSEQNSLFEKGVFKDGVYKAIQELKKEGLI